jgi:hypothetical protein
VDSLRRWRQPVAVVLLVASGVRLLAGIVAVPVLAAADAYGSVATAALFEGSRAGDSLLLLATAAAAAWCLAAPPTSSGRVIATLAVVELVTTVVVSLVFGLLGLTADAVGRGVLFVQFLAALVLPAVAAVLLLALLRAAPATSVAAVPPATSAESAALPPTVPPGTSLAPPPPPDLPPSWTVDQAAGVAWQTAGDAAAGNPPTGWSAPAETAGWQPIPGPPAPPGPERPA